MYEAAYEAARVRRHDGKEVADHPTQFVSLTDAQEYVANTPVSLDGVRPWIRNMQAKTFLLIGGRPVSRQATGVPNANC